MHHEYVVYILANLRGRRPVLYIGITRDIARRMLEHRAQGSSFTARYRVDALVHLERYADARAAISREKHLKGWTRARKIALICKHNPQWRDLMPATQAALACSAPGGGPSLRSG